MIAEHTAIVLVGAGGHAKVLLDALAFSGRNVIGLTDVDSRLHGAMVGGAPVLGDDSVLSEFPASSTRLVNAVGTVDVPTGRRLVYERFRALGYAFISIAHPSAIVGNHVEVGNGAQLMAGVILQPGSTVGENAILNTGAQVDHDCVIGAHSHIAPGVTLSGSVRIGECSHLGVGATVIQGVRIGSGCLVAAGAVVVRDVPDGARVAGVPARSLRR
ncbi:acetyltransferase [Pseudorhodoplanes sp.]|uniref:acetyltransferase n=1 Tax=Pseudorhodoplanes sp. TaxID=1934341 RepID=UPI003D0B1855